jgi:hypothetical protein
MNYCLSGEGCLGELSGKEEWKGAATYTVLRYEPSLNFFQDQGPAKIMSLAKFSA